MTIRSRSRDGPVTISALHSLPPAPEIAKPAEMVRLIRLHAPSIASHASAHGVAWVGDGRALLGAIAECESAFDGWDPPRCEPAYYNYPSLGKYFRTGGATYQAAIKKWGALAACSWGPFQIMYYNCLRFGYPIEQSPYELWWPDVSLGFVVALSIQIIATKPPTPADFGDAYNSGNWRDVASSHVLEYRERFTRHFGAVVIRRGL